MFYSVIFSACNACYIEERVEALYDKIKHGRHLNASDDKSLLIIYPVSRYILKFIGAI